MKTSLLAAIAFIPCLAFAGSTSTSTPPEVARNLSVMTERLKLTQSQQDRIRPIMVAEWNKKQLIESSTLSDKKKHDEIGANHRAALQKIKTVFTARQMAQINDDMNHHGASSTNPGT